MKFVRAGQQLRLWSHPKACILHEVYMNKCHIHVDVLTGHSQGGMGAVRHHS